MNPQVSSTSPGFTQGLNPSVTKSEAILAASVMLPRDTPAKEIAQLLTEQGIPVDARYVRTVQQREQKKQRPAPQHVTQPMLTGVTPPPAPGENPNPGYM